ncbi:MAG: hypothetical protein RRC07_04190 [Anaerolineae bacterium]|nr:hypothetical protein [Anaerolineae bacterium]
MPQPTLTAIPLEVLAPWLAMVAFGAYHGLNPGMGWLFALSMGLQRQSERAIWVSLLPIAAGHAASLALVAVLVIAGAQFLSTTILELATAAVLLSFGLYKIINHYRHPRWVGMKIGMRDLAWWSFLMAVAHGAGLMIAPFLLGMTANASAGGEHAAHASHGAATLSSGVEMSLSVAVHTLSMLVVMALVAWIVYKRLGLAILRQRWVNFDLIWAVALLVVGGIALLSGVGIL